MIGEVVQHILDNGFFMSFMYDDIRHFYQFKACKCYEGDICQATWVYDSFMVSEVSSKDILIMQADMYLKQIDDAIAQRRLIASAPRKEG